jgi:hypothetical protein
MRGPDADESDAPGRECARIPASVAEVLDLTAELLYARWRRAVDLLWREAVRRRRERLTERERARSARRMKNLQKIVRKALSDYHRIELERQKR